MKDNILKKEELVDMIRSLIAEQLEAYVREHELKAKELSLLERIIRVEEELKAQREIIASLQKEMIVRFEAMDERFVVLQREMDRRFGVIEKRFEAMDKRFEAMEKRFEVIEKRFEAMDERFELLQREMDKRFESVEKHLSFLQWFMTGGFTFISILITIVNFLK